MDEPRADTPSGDDQTWPGDTSIVRPSHRLFRTDAGDIWTSALFGIAHAGALLALFWTVGLAIVVQVDYGWDAEAGIVSLTGVLIAPMFALVYLRTRR